MDTERIAAYLRHEIGEWTKGGGTVIALAKAVGVSGPYISQLRAGQRGVGLGAMQGFADHWKITLAQLEERANAWAKQNPSAAPSRGRGSGRWGRTASAIARAREDGRSERAIQAVGAAILLPEPAVRLSLARGRDGVRLAREHRTTQSIAWLRIAEVTQTPAALVMPGRVRTTGGRWVVQAGDHGRARAVRGDGVA